MGEIGTMAHPFYWAYLSGNHRPSISRAERERRKRLKRIAKDSKRKNRAA